MLLDDFHDDARWRVLQQVLESSTFRKAPRMCALLSFLVARTLAGKEASITEHAIGTEVFRRSACDYDTGTDPVVRVHMGRLRERLARHYAGSADADGMRIAIPAGTYVPVFAPAACGPRQQPSRLELTPLRSLTCDQATGTFVAGLEEELAQHLFERLGKRGVPSLSCDCRVEVSVRVEPGHVRASLRLVLAATGHTTWLRQYDVHGSLGIRLQEELALTICRDLQRHVPAAVPPVPAFGTGLPRYPLAPAI